MKVRVNEYVIFCHKVEFNYSKSGTFLHISCFLSMMLS